MLPGAIQGDAGFTAFQSKLATVVTTARAQGVTISNRFDPGCRCPLGAHPDSIDKHPPSMVARQGGWAEVSQAHLSDFICGYSLGDEREVTPYYELGVAYREQFP
jgi:hypothetical protein